MIQVCQLQKTDQLVLTIDQSSVVKMNAEQIKKALGTLDTFMGIFTIDSIPILDKKKGFYIVNTDKKNGNG